MTATLDAPAQVLPPSDWRTRLLPLVPSGGGWGVTLLVTLFAGLLRFIRLGQPDSTLTDKGVLEGPGYIFDEVYYACDAHSLMTHGVELHATSGKGTFCVFDGDPAFVVHPPLGKWLIGLGEQAFGFNAFGWRVAAALFGTLTVLLVVRIGRRMLGSTLLGALAGVLLSLDGLHFVQSRVAMVDVFLCFWVVAAFGALVVDRDRIRQRLSRADDDDLARGGSLGRRPWRLVAGLCMGAALATKWSALFPLVVLIVLALFWEAGARRTAGIGAPWRRTLRRTTVAGLACFVLVPVVVYLLSWSGWFLTSNGYDRDWAATHPGTALVPDALRSLWAYHKAIYHIHATLDSKHPYQSHPLTWPFLGRPVSYYYPPGVGPGDYGCTVATCSREVLAIGTPMLWWAMIPAAIGLAARWVSRRDWRAAALLLMTAVSILAWVPSDLQHRTMFLFYALPSVPFLCLGLALLAGWIIGEPGSSRRVVGSAGVGVYVALVAVNFIYLYPVLAAVTIPYAEWSHRMWFHSWI
jgi:dolichyl-phosphate-mannose--protein O-mannosyl transferase